MSLLLLSGGIESTCLAHALRPKLCLTIDYGQTVAKAEIQASKNICVKLRLRHEVTKLDLRRYATGSMAGAVQSFDGAAPEWWAFRNQLLISIAAIVGFKGDQQEILIGTIRSDRIHKDGGQRFLSRMDRLLRDQEGGLRLRAPARKMSSEELITWSKPSLSLLGLTFSCHRSIYCCGQCRGCRKNEAAVAYAIRLSKH